MNKRILLSAGGTGGHLFPAQAVAEKLDPSVEVLFVAGGLKTSPFFNRNRFSYHDLPVATLHFSHPWKMIKNIARIGRGVIKALKILRDFKPDLVIGFGSFYSFPVLTAALLLKIPILLHEQNVLPGRVNRLFSRWAYKTAISFEGTKLIGKTQLVRFPNRKYAQCDPWDYFGWKPGEKIILICGGSQGAQKLNQFISNYPWKGVRLLHIVGNRPEEVQYITRLYQQRGISAQVKAFEPRLDLAMQIAEFAICRAGAATLSELIFFRTPAILVPFPYAQDDHQWFNADFFVRTIGGGAVIREAALDVKALGLVMSDLNVSVCKMRLDAYYQKRQAEDFELLVYQALSTDPHK